MDLEQVMKEEVNSKEFEYRGYAGRIRRIRPETMGHLCGYIQIPVGHELYGMDIREEIENKLIAEGSV